MTPQEEELALSVIRAASRWKRARIALDRRETSDMSELWAARVELCLRVAEWEDRGEEEGKQCRRAEGADWPTYQLGSW